MKFAVLTFNKKSKKYDKTVYESESKENAEKWAEKYLGRGRPKTFGEIEENKHVIKPKF